MKPFKFLPLLIILTITGFVMFGTPSAAEAATKYWIGSSGGNFSSNSNWSTTSGGSNDTTAPGSSDIATFNGANTNNATLDTTVNVAGMDIRSDGGGSGYTGTITQGSGIAVTIGTSNFSQAAGTFTGSAASITNNGTFTLSGGTFTSTSGTMTANSTFTKSGGTFTHNNGTVTFALLVLL